MSSTDAETLQHIKDVELLILKDFIKICEEHDIEYYLWFGTEIGAVRHQGFIPWDDDIDLVLFREDYEKFLKVMEEDKCKKYSVFDTRYDEHYFFQFGRLSLNGTHWNEYWDSEVPFKLGLHVDLFVLDKVPNNKFKRFLFMRTCIILCKLYSISTIKFYNYNKLVVTLLNTTHSIFNTIGLTPKFFQKHIPSFFRKYETTNQEYYADLSMNEQAYFKINDLKPAKKAKFEDIEAFIPNNQDATLGQVYGDYMQLPPEEERIYHILNEIDFGEY